MSPIWTKLNLKNQKEIVVLNAPVDFEPELKGLQKIRILRQPARAKEQSDFVLLFAKSSRELESARPRQSFRSCRLNVDSLFRHSGACRNPGICLYFVRKRAWMPAFAGMTNLHSPRGEGFRPFSRKTLIFAAINGRKRRSISEIDRPSC